MVTENAPGEAITETAGNNPFRSGKTSMIISCLLPVKRAGSGLIFKFTAVFYAMMIKSIFISDKTRRNCLYPSILNMAPGILNAGCPMQIAVI